MSLPHDIRLARALRDIRVRFARDAEGVMIAQMVHSNHEGVPNTTWERVYPYWMVAENFSEVVGCVQICYGLPVSRIEFLSFAPNLPFRTRALAGTALLELASKTLSGHGAHVVAGTVPFDQRGYRDILKANGCTILASGNTMARQIA